MAGRITSKLTSKAQVTIPKAIRDCLNIGPHDEIEWSVDPIDGRVRVTSGQGRAYRSISELAGILGPLPNGMTLEEAREIAWHERALEIAAKLRE